MTFNPGEHLIDLKGKSYLQVMWRLVWFREEHPDWTINTELISHDSEKCHAIFRAAVTDAEGRLLSVGHGSESAKDFRDYLEKAETKAVGRALAMLGYGTQFAPELDEGERIVDSPVKRYAGSDDDPLGSKPVCAYCAKPICDALYNGKKYTAKQIAALSQEKYGVPLHIECADSYKAIKDGGQDAE